MMEITSSTAVTIESARMALGAAAMRQKLIANNIANVNSKEHIRMKVVFEEQLAEALSHVSDAGNSESVMLALSGVQPQLTQASAKGTSVQLDQEMVDMSANTLRYQALAKALTRYMSIASLVVAGGRG